MKKGITLLLLMARRPVLWLWEVALHHVLTSGYRAYLWLRKRFFLLYAPFRLHAVGFFTNKYTIHVAVLSLVFLVTATNLYAGETLPETPDHSRTSLVNDIMSDDGELVVEGADEGEGHDGSSVQIVSNALGPEDGAGEAPGEADSDDGIYDDEAPTDAYESPLANALRPGEGTSDSESRPSQPAARENVVEYVVNPGDNIGSIARLFGLSVETVLNANSLNVRSLIRIGQKIRIPPVDGLLYKVKKGDTLSKIAKTYKTDTDKIAAANKLENDKELAVGTELILPGGKLPPPPAPKAPAVSSKNLANIFIPPPAQVEGSGMIWPTAARRITQYWRGRRHTGVDIAGPTGTAIYAAQDGIVITAGWNRGGYGNMLVVDHGGGVYSRYAHNSKLLVAAGDIVSRGQVIALMGSTGRSTGPHLHFEIMTGNSSHRVNPLQYVQ